MYDMNTNSLLELVLYCYCLDLFYNSLLFVYLEFVGILGISFALDRFCNVKRRDIAVYEVVARLDARFGNIQ